MQRKVNGILLLNKPLHASSNHALQYVKNLFKAQKAGHTGSLDPLATGMLPICFGEATKFSQFLLEADKTYKVCATLGVKTLTGDAEGPIVSERPINFTAQTLDQTLTRFMGAIQQIPPMHSAIKVKGQPLYKLARQGIEIKREARTVYIHKISVEEKSAQTITFMVECSKGTYIRTLVEDIGESLGCGAYVSALHRISVHPYHNQAMHDLISLSANNSRGGDFLSNLLLPIDSALLHLPQLHITNSASFYLYRGQSIALSDPLSPGFVRLYANHNFMGVGEVTKDAKVMPKRLVAA